MSRVLHATSLIVTDRRWAAPLSALALGFGLFVGVAIGPSAAGSLATGGAQIIEIPGLGGVAGGGDGDGGSGSSAALAGPAAGAAGGTGGGGGGAVPSSGAALPSFAPVVAGDPGFSGDTATPTAPAPSDPDSSEPASPGIAVADAVAVAEPDVPTASECADLTAILVQIYADDPVGLPYGDAVGLQAALCPGVAPPAGASRVSASPPGPGQAPQG